MILNYVQQRTKITDEKKNKICTEHSKPNLSTTRQAETNILIIQSKMLI